ncbi:queuosine precursor transporter [Haloplasma contractile]|uniref:Probable queuosine precursor transporter n=1 Tax=Haloplasma contractile SSD-17B TaxID=1033810 RepID=F7PWX2_9MOLU|nr:queuosine precursor transporter [Haloplasma contractile]ERJ12582.1 putative ACR protein [Haloplasma contractile SSD-17B]
MPVQLFEILSPLPNEVMWLIFVLINFGAITVFYKLFGKTGLLVWIGFGTVIANIQVTKTIEIFGLTATLGNIMYGTLFLVTDALGEKYGYKAARKAVYLGFLTLIATVIIMQYALVFSPLNEGWALPAHEALKVTFGFLPRIALGSLIAYIISQLLDVHIFARIKRQFNSNQKNQLINEGPVKGLWIRNNISTLISQFVDSIIFVSIAFLGDMPFDIWIEILITTYFIKVIVAALDTPFVYWIRNIKPIED